jgi:hypothetical protein
MKKSLLAIVVFMAVLVCLVFALHHDHTPAADLSATEQESAASSGNSEAAMTQSPGEHRATGQNTKVRFNPEFLAQAAKPADDPPPLVARARDRYYDRLLLKQGRDQAKEEQLLSRLMDVFGDRPDTSVGEVACSAEFCRVDLQGSGKVDVRKQWQQDIFSAVEPKGLRFFVVSNDDADNTMASCYFGRDASWTVPDFSKPGLM